MENKIRNAIDDATQWMKFKGVEGIAQGEKEGRVCIVVFVSVDPNTLVSDIPSFFKGFPVVFESSGEFEVQQ